MSLKSANSNVGNGPGGPRTVHGKSKSSRNSLKHGIFVDRVLPHEEAAAAVLNDALQAEFHLRGAVELKIGRDLVQNELEASRIESFALQQFQRARLLSKLSVESFESRHTPFCRYPIPKEKAGEPGYRTCLRPAVCTMFLCLLKRQIEKFGLQPDADLACLSAIYGDQLSPCGEVILFHYNLFTASERRDKADGTSTKPKKIDPQVLIIEAIDREIKFQELKEVAESRREVIESAFNCTTLPPDHEFDRIERYRTAAARKFSRLLNNLETVRRLKQPT
jgi:hypothetical protein